MPSGKVKLEYDLDGDQIQERQQAANNIWLPLKNCEKCSIVKSARSHNNHKYHAGIKTELESNPFRLSRKLPRGIRSNISVPVIKINSATLCMFPDKIYVAERGQIFTLSYSCMRVDSKYIEYVECGRIPSDANIVGHNWKYINKDGSQDLRFKNNRKIPVCKYYLIIISFGRYELPLICSNVNAAKLFENNLKIFSTSPIQNTEVRSFEKGRNDTSTTISKIRFDKKKILLILLVPLILLLSLTPLYGGITYGKYVGGIIGLIHAVPACFFYFQLYREKITYSRYALIYIITFFGSMIAIVALFPIPS